MKEFIQKLASLQQGCKDEFRAIQELASVLPEEISPVISKEEVVLEPPPQGDYGDSKSLRITPQGLEWLRRSGEMVTTAYRFNSGEASPELASQILNSWFEYWARIQKELAETRKQLTLRNRQIRDLRRQLRK